MYTQSEAIIQQKLLFAKKEAAALLSISIRKLEYLIANGELQTRRIGKRVLVPKGALTTFARTDHCARHTEKEQEITELRDSGNTERQTERLKSAEPTEKNRLCADRV